MQADHSEDTTVHEQPAITHRSILDFRPAIVILLLIKGLDLGVGAIAYQIINNTLLTPFRAWLGIWNGWDAPHYLDIAQYGYESTGERANWLVFYPLFPALTRLVGSPLNDYLIGAFVVSTIASIVAAILFYRLVAFDYDATIANQAVWFLAIFPTAYFLHIGYTESLFIALVLGAFVAARTERWPLVAMLGALACLTRVNGLLLVPALGIEPLLTWWRTRRWNWQWLWLAVIPVGFGGYLWINYAVSGDPLRFLTITREHWYKEFAPPWTGLMTLIHGLTWRPPIEIWSVIWQQLFFVVLIFCGMLASWRWLRPSYTVWIGLNLLLVTSTSFILSVPRYSLTLFPLMILFALLARRFLWQIGITAWSLIFHTTLVILFLLQKGLAY